MKGVIKPAHIGINNFTLQVTGLPDLTLISAGSLEEELQTTELPDRTVASGGNTLPVEFDIEIPSHHDVEVAAMEEWYKEAQDPVSPTYKRSAVLIQRNIEGTVKRTYTLEGLFPMKRATPDLELENEGEMSTITWTMKTDKVEPTK